MVWFVEISPRVWTKSPLVVLNKCFHSFFSRETERDLSIENRPIVTLWGRFLIGKSRPFDAEKCSKHFCYGLLVVLNKSFQQKMARLLTHVAFGKNKPTWLCMSCFRQLQPGSKSKPFFSEIFCYGLLTSNLYKVELQGVICLLMP